MDVVLRWPIRKRSDEELQIGFFAPTPPPPAGSKTLAEWNGEGMRVNKGSKSVGRNKAGVALFSPAQVHRPARRWVGDEDLYGSSPDDDWDDHSGYRDYADAFNDGGW